MQSKDKHREENSTKTLPRMVTEKKETLTPCKPKKPRMIFNTKAPPITVQDTKTKVVPETITPRVEIPEEKETSNRTLLKRIPKNQASSPTSLPVRGEEQPQQSRSQSAPIAKPLIEEAEFPNP